MHKKKDVGAMLDDILFRELLEKIEADAQRQMYTWAHSDTCLNPFDVIQFVHMVKKRLGMPQPASISKMDSLDVVIAGKGRPIFG